MLLAFSSRKREQIQPNRLWENCVESYPRNCLVLLYFAMWLVRKTSANLTTNQIQHYDQLRQDHSRSLALQAVYYFILLLCELIGSLRYFPFHWLVVWLPWFWSSVSLNMIYIFLRSQERLTTLTVTITSAYSNAQETRWTLSPFLCASRSA